MRRLAEEMFKMPMEVPEYEEEAAYGAALTVGKLAGNIENKKNLNFFLTNTFLCGILCLVRGN